jgi:ubiquinone/menaquinone biosynthesis C-methylase UbiE
MEIKYEKAYFTNGKDLDGYMGYMDYPAHTKRVDKIISMANPYSVLDVGCAYGYIVRRLIDRGINAYGIDVSKWCGKQASKIIPNHFILHDMRKRLPFGNKQFDLLYCEGVLEHIEPKYIPDIMYEFERVANKRMIQVSFATHPDAARTTGHICLQPREFWFAIIPAHTWLMYEDNSSDKGEIWLYKC